MSKHLFNITAAVMLLIGSYGVQTQAFSYDTEFISASKGRVSADRFSLSTDSTVSELVIIDAAVPDKLMFYQQNKPGTKIVEIQSNEDGLTQLVNILKNHQNLDVLHLVSHASDGVIYLGQTQVTFERLLKQADTLITLDDAMKDGADVLLYGCNLGSGKAGEDLIELIADQAHVNVAASNDLTGAFLLGGNWELEVSTGKINSARLWSKELENQYSHVLATPVFNTPPDILNISPGGGTLTVELNMEGGASYVVLPDGASAPTNVQVQSGTDGSGNAAIAAYSTSDSNPANTAFSTVINGLSTETTYDVYVIGYDKDEADKSGVNDTLPVKIDLTTAALGATPDGAQTFTGIAIINNIGQTNDGYFNLTRLDGSGTDKALEADQYGAYIDDIVPAPSSFTSSIKVNMTVPGSFQITDMELGEYKSDSSAASNNFINIQVIGYKDGVSVAQSALYTPPLDTYLTDYTAISWADFSGVDVDEFEVFYTMSIGDKQNEFNLIGFSIMSMSTVVNALPTITINNTSFAYTENSTTTQIDSAAALSDADGDSDWDNGTLVVQITGNNEAGDELSIQDNIIGNINSSGTNIRDSATVIGTLSASEGTVTNGTALTITFNSSATNVLVQQVLQAISYRSTSDDPGTSDRTVTFTATDTNSASANDTRTIVFTALNDQPTLSAADEKPTFTEGGTAVSVFSSAAASTVESGQTLTALILTVTNVNDGSNEILLIDGTAVTLTHGTSGTTATNSASYSVSVSGTTATVTLNSMTVSTAELQTLVDGVSYQNNSQNPNTSNRIITITSLTDSGSSTGSNDNINNTLAVSSTVSVDAVNDAPTDIALSASSINQGLTALGADIGTLSAVDLDDNSFDYFLAGNGTADYGACGVGNDADNASFQINTAILETAGVLTAGSYKVCVHVKDADFSFEKTMTITVTDNVAPTISAVSIANSAHKVGDMVTATITVSTDSDDYTTGSGGISGTINGYALGSLSKTNDTTYSATFTITDGGSDVASGSDVPVSFALTDSAGNTSSTFTTAVSQSSDAVYANLPEISLTADTNSIAEDGGVSTLTATISGSLNNQWPEDITVSLAYTGTGTAGTDYSKFDSITITAGSSSGTAALTGTADTLFDAAADETAIVDISSLSVGAEGATNQQTITINDAESTPTVTLSAGNSMVAENAGTSTITATLNNATYADVTVNLGYTGTATSGGSDYNTASSFITIPAGSTSASAVTGITAVDDSVLEGDETIIIDITSVSGGSALENGTQQQTVTISDDEDGTAPTISAVSIANSAHKVGDTVTATITVSTDSDDYTTGSGGISGTINGYALGSLSKTNDTTYSATFTITDGGSDVASGSDVPVSFALTDSAGNTSSTFTTAVSQSSDAVYANLPEISLTADTNSIAEDGGVSTLTATISGSLNNQWPEDITVSLAYTGTGTAGTDYSKFDSITITAGSSSGTAALTGTADTLFDAAAAETAIVDISSLSVGNEGAANQQTITINDAESTPTVTLSAGNSMVAENAGTSTITATLNNATYADVTVNLGYTGTATSGGSDYNTASSSITIPAGSTSASAVTGITAVDDAVLEGDETIIIDITSVSGGSALENGTQQQTVTISDDEDGTAPTISAVSIANSAHKVGDTVTATITVSTDSDDYTTGSGGISGTINGYALGSLSKTNDTTYSATFTITDGGSDVASGSDVPVSFTLTDSAGNTSSAFTTAVSQSSDAVYANLPEISLTADTNSIVEFAGVSTITATISGSLNNQWPDDITVSLAYTGTGTAGTDYSKSDSITIAAGSSSNSAMIISAPDSLFDAAAAETAIVDISSLSVGNEGATNQQTITINDAQSTPTVTLSTGNSTVAENAGTSTITATLNNATYADVTVNLGYTGTATSGGSDYNTASSFITIPAGSTSASAVTGITAVDDSVLEGDETIIIDITSVSGGSASESGSQQKTITISDDERIAASLSVSSSTIDEAAGQAVVTVTLDKAAIEAVTVDLGFSGTAGSFDYSTTADSITIDAGQTQGTINITSLADQIVEVNETIIIDISGVSGSSADENGVQQQTIIITSAPTPMITSAAYDASTGYLVVSGVNFESTAGSENDVDISLLTLTGKGDTAESYKLTSSTDVELDSATQFTVIISGEDKTSVDNILDKIGSSASDAQLYNLAAADDFMGNTTNEDTSDPLGNGIIVSKVAPMVNTPASAVILNSDLQTISGSYSTDGISISLYLDADNDGVSDGGTALGSDVVSAGAWSIETSLADDTVYNTVVIADFSGAQESAHVDVVTITEDSTAPVDPVVITPAVAVNESGSSYNISGSHAENDVIVKLYADNDNDGAADNASVLASDIVAANAWSLITGIDLGANNFVVVAEDTAVNSSSSIDVATITGNTRPSITQGSPAVLITTEDTPGEITLNASDAESNTLTWSISSQAANGVAAADGIGNSKAISFVPDSNFNGSDSFTVSVTDNMESDSIVVNVTVNSVNDSPVFTTAPETSAAEDIVYSYSVAASDNDDSNIIISAVSKPGWLTLVSNANGSAELSGTPVNADVGNHNVVLIVSDTHSGSVTQSFTVAVSNTNDAPVISGKPAVSVHENSSYSFTPVVFDDDLNDTKTFLISNKPDWAAFDSATGALTGTPGNADVGTTTGIIISVKDSAQVSDALAAFNLQVINVNNVPAGVVAIVGNAVEDSVLTAANTLTDADGLGTLIYQWKADGVNVGTNSNTYTPDDEDVGKAITLTISYTDAHNTVESKSSGATAAVLNVNDAPAGTLSISGSAAEHSMLTAHNTLSDADGLGKLNYQWYADNNAVDGADASVYTLTAAEIGKTITVVISYTDAHNTVESKVSAPTASVVNVNDAPLISGTPATSVEVLNSYSFIPTVNDVDAGDTVTFTIVNKPGWANFDTKTGVLTGTPVEENVGTTSAIVITASDSADAKSSLTAFNITVTEIDKTPSLLGIEDIEVNAQALLTQAVLGEVTAEDYLGEAIEPVKPDSLLAPGEHVVIWKAVDSSGNEVTANQVVKVHPLISLGKNTYIKEGESYSFKVYLNGNAPQYPVSVPYMVYGENQQSLGPLEYVTISEQDKTYGEFIISAAMTSAHSILTVQLDPLNSINGLNLDIKSSLILTRIEENIAPKVDLTVVQEGQERTQVTTTGNEVTITASSMDSNKDTLETVWSSENNALVNSSSDENQFIFEPQTLPTGVYKVTATVTETNTAERYSNTQDVYINVTLVLPDYVSASSELPDNTLSHKASDGNKYLLEAEPGTKVTFGRLSLQESEGGVKVSIETIEQDPSIELDDAENVSVGGIFDFEIHELPVNGQSVNMVLPLREVIPEDAVYRKYISSTGWTDFVEDSNNALYSAKGADGYCPPPSSSAYTQDLTAGDWCVRLTIEDGGPNDDDGKANGTIIDPSGVTVNTPVVVPVVPVTPVTPAEPAQSETSIVNTSGGGGSSGIMLILMTILSALCRYAKKTGIFSLALLSFSSQANDWFIDVDLGVSKAHEGDNLSSVPDDNIINRDDKDISWSLGLGYNLTDNWILAARYIDLGQGSAELKGSTADYHQSVINVMPILVKGVGLEVSYRFYSYQAFSSSVTLGGLAWRSEIESSFNGKTIDHTQKGNDFYAGAAAAYDLSKSWQAAVVYKRYFIDVNDVDNLGMRLTYSF